MMRPGLMLLVFLTGCAAAATTTDVEPASPARSSSGSSSGGSKVGQMVADLTVEDLSGKPIKVSSYRGQVLLLDVWASWCVPCKQELPMLDDIQTRLRSKGVAILAVSVDQERENVLKFLDSRKRWSMTIAHDPKGEIAELMQPQKMPTSYMVDREGIIRYVNLGFVPSDARVIERRLLDLASAGQVGQRRRN